MPLAPGNSVGPYRIVAALGAGGMGEVYKARDTRLDRDVAIKVLAQDLAARPDVYQRFEREARAVSALNHANICSLFDIGSHEGMPYLVMECLEGETLAERLARGPVPLADAWPILLQIGAALEAAHARGIVHRDLKPANIMLTGAGVVKLLDFGLAKLDASRAAVSGATATMAATLTTEGTIVGTFQYMAPEQLEGKEADARTDIFAFGAVLYETLTGRKAFAGQTHASLIASIMAAEPPRVSAVAPVAPPALDRLVQKCLAKNPDDRWQTARELTNEIRWISESGSQAALAPAIAGRPGRRWLWKAWAIGASLLFLATMAGWAWTAGWFRPGPVTVGTVRFPLVFPEGASLPGNRFFTFTPQFAPSPDGRRIAFIAIEKDKSYLWVRPLDSQAAQRLDRTEGANFPFWSPDGQYIGFFADKQLKRISASGGSLQTICATGATGTAPGAGAAWGGDGVIVFAPVGSGLMRVPAAGGVPVAVTTLDRARAEFSHEWPQFLPDGRHFLYFAVSKTSEKSGIYAQELSSAQRKLVRESRWMGAYASGHLLYPREDTLLAQKFDLGAMRVEGEAVSIAEDVHANLANGRAAFAVSTNGVLVYRSGPRGGLTQPTWYDRDGRRLGTAGEPDRYTYMSLSPDEKRVALTRSEAKKRAGTLWALELANGVMTRLTFQPEESVFVPVWSPDSGRIAFGDVAKGGLSEVTVASATRTALNEDKNALYPEDYSPDGKTFAWTERGGTKLMLLSLSDRKSQAFESQFPRHNWHYSPDGRYLAYVSNATGIYELYVTTPSFSEVRKISNGGASNLVWRRGTNELYYIGAEQRLSVVEIKGGARIDPVVPRPLFPVRVQGSVAEFSVAADGKRFLVNESIQSGEGQVNIVVHWDADLKK
jgi:Tol biopolymer transport system component/tRNA A-37 threonylcarbamoyl transferase component Bud32